MYNNKGFRSKFISLFVHDEESYTKYWEKQRKSGKLKYYLSNMGFAALAFIILSLITLYFKGNFFGWQNGAAIAAAILIGLIAGCISSPMTWSINESKYNAIKNKSET